jgi:1-acyl-sn-glycerol-3-phosphate acyltransferase
VSGYDPTSGCGRGCLPRKETVPTVALPLRVARVVALVTVLFAGIGVALSVPLLTAAGRARAKRRWFRAVVAASGIRLVVIGVDHKPSVAATDRVLSGGGATLIAANHVSWLDIPTVLAVEPMRVLAKSDVRGWPVIGLLASRGGTLFIDRARLRRLPGTVAEIADTLRGGESVLAFPEGTTWCGRTPGRFYPATLQSAVDAGVPVRPVSLRYRLSDGSVTTAAAFVGDDTMFASVWRVVSARGLVVELEASPLVETAGRTRRETAAETAAWVKGQPAAVKPPPLRSIPVSHVP